MVSFFINDNPKSASYKCKERELLKKSWWNFDNVRILTERNLSVILEILQITKQKHLFVTSITEFEDNSATEISQFILQALSSGINVYFIGDKLHFYKSTIREEVYEAIFTKYKELHPITKES